MTRIILTKHPIGSPMTAIPFTGMTNLSNLKPPAYPDAPLDSYETDLCCEASPA